METIGSMARRLAPQIGQAVYGTDQRTEEENIALATAFCEECLEMPSDEPGELTAMHMKDGKPVRVMSFNVLKALAFVASAVGVVAGAGTPISVACAVVAMACSVEGIKRIPPKAERALIWILQTSEERRSEMHS